MKAKIKILSNYEAIKKGDKVGLDVAEEEEVSTLYFKKDNLSHFYIDDTNDEQDIVIVLYPNFIYRACWDEALYRTLKSYFENF